MFYQHIEKPRYMKLIQFNVVICLILLNSCTNKIDKKEKMNNSSKKDTEFQSSYGFVVQNEKELLFYAIDKKIMNKYIKQQVSSEQMIMDIKSTDWVTDFGGSRFEKFAFLNWFVSYYNKEITIDYCKEQLKSKIIPVFLVELPYDSELKYSNLNPCEGEVLQLPFQTSSRPSLNVVFIEPLNAEYANQFLNFKDTVDRSKYLDYIKFNCH